MVLRVDLHHRVAIYLFIQFGVIQKFESIFEKFAKLCKIAYNSLRPTFTQTILSKEEQVL